VNPISNPYTPGAGSRPPALAGRDEELRAFEILLERLRRGRPEKSMNPDFQAIVFTGADEGQLQIIAECVAVLARKA
jgi:hypothetical protein